jgi:hypothetical protein
MNIYVAHLRTCADQLHEAYDILKISCTREAATSFIAAFNRTLLAIERVHGKTPPSPSGGRMAVAKEEKQELLAKPTV